MKVLFTILLFPLYLFSQQNVTTKQNGVSILVKLAGQSINLSPVVDTTIFLVDYANINDAIIAAQATGKRLMMPVTYNLTTKLSVQGDFKMGALSRCTITDITTPTSGGYAILLRSGTHDFSNINFYTPGAVTDNYSFIKTEQEDIIWNNYFHSCRWTGNSFDNYQSTNGHTRNITGFYNCNMYAYSENIQYFSQSGPKDLIMYDDTMQTIVSHNVYSHPINNYDIKNYLCLGANINAFNSYGTATSVTIGLNQYQRFDNCRSADTVKARSLPGKPTWRLWSSAAPVYLTNSDVLPFEFAGKFYVTNTKITNGGNGTALGNDAEVFKCTGDITVRAGENIKVDSSNLISLGISAEATAIVTNSILSNGGGNQHIGTYTNCSFPNAFDIYNNTTYTNVNNNITFNSCTFGLAYYNQLRIFGGIATNTLHFNNTIVPPIGQYSNP